MLTQTVDAPESINHLFVHCQYAQDVWRAAPFTTDGDNRLGRVLAGGVLETLFTAYGHHHKPPRTVDSMGISASPPNRTPIKGTQIPVRRLTCQRCYDQMRPGEQNQQQLDWAGPSQNMKKRWSLWEGNFKCSRL